MDGPPETESAAEVPEPGALGPGAAAAAAAAAAASGAAPARAPAGRRVLLLVGALAFGLVAGLLVHFTAERTVRSEHVARGTSALSVPLGGRTGADLTARVALLSPRVRWLTSRVSLRGRAFDVRSSDVGLTLDERGTQRALLAAGREGGLTRQLGFWLARLFTAHDVPVAIRLDSALAQAFLDRIEREGLGEPASEGTVSYRDGLVVTYPREGWAIEREGALTALREALLGGAKASSSPLALPVRHVVPRLTRADVDRARSEAEAWLRGPIALTVNESAKRLTFSVQDLGAALVSRSATEPAPKLELSFDQAALLAVVEKARKELEVPPRDATYEVGPGHELTLVPSVVGRRLDDARVVSLVHDLARGSERTAELPFLSDVPPKLITEEVAGLGIKELVSRYTTYFPCCEARVKNIERMAALLDGKIVRPGEQLSVNAVSGPRTTAGGFVAGPTLVEGEMEMTIGGGASQFATTLFNAVFEGGYEIIQRQAHTYWFPRYPEGHDATLGFPLPDLIFRNDGKAGLLIKAEIGKTKVTVSLYGDKEGRKVERHLSRRFDVIEPKTEYLPNVELLPEEPKVKQRGQPGWSLHVSRTVTFADGTKKEERRRVVYNPRVHRIETHPCEIPEGDPEFTGEKCPEPEPDAGAPAPP